MPTDPELLRAGRVAGEARAARSRCWPRCGRDSWPVAQSVPDVDDPAVLSGTPMVYWPGGLDGLPLPDVPRLQDPAMQTRFFATILLLCDVQLERLRALLADCADERADLLLPTRGQGWWITRPVGVVEAQLVLPGWHRVRIELTRTG